CVWRQARIAPCLHVALGHAASRSRTGVAPCWSVRPTRSSPGERIGARAASTSRAKSRGGAGSSAMPSLEKLDDEPKEGASRQEIEGERLSVLRGFPSASPSSNDAFFGP